MIAFLVALFILAVCVLAFWKYWQREPADLSDDIILITGAGGGIGRSLALALSKYCRSIIGVDINEKGLEETAALVLKENNVQMKCYPCDLSNADEIKKLAEDVRKTYGRITMLINNAGIVNGKYIVNIKNASVERLIRVNLLAPIYLMLEFLPGMLGNAYEDSIKNVPSSSQPPAEDVKDKSVDKPPKGHFIFVSSILGQTAMPSGVDYSASKAGLSAAADTLRVELDVMGAAKHIYVTDIRPFAIATELYESYKSRLPFFYPVVRSEDAVQRMVEAIRHREKVVYIPWWMWFIPLIHRTLPYPLLRLFSITSRKLPKNE